MRITIDENDSITVELDNGHVQKFPECWQEDCVKAAVKKEKAEARELRCEELEQELRDAQAQMDEYIKEGSHRAALYSKLQRELRDTQEKLDKQEDCNERIIAARDELRKQRDVLMKRIGEMEQELRELRDQLAVNAKICDMRETVDGEQKKLIENLRERIQEQDVTIAKYDDENKKLWMQNRDLGKWLHKNAPRNSLTDWSKKIHDNAVKHGWWAKPDADAGESCADGDRPFGEIIALCHSELSEALEEYRNGKPMSYEGENGKPEGVAVEMIDCIIRILDWCGKEGIDVDELLRKKHAYNKTRPYRHGGKKL